MEPENEPDRPGVRRGKSSFIISWIPFSSCPICRKPEAFWTWVPAPVSPGSRSKIARPGLTIDLVEATAKKASFLKEVVRRLGLSGTAVIPVFLGEIAQTL